MDKMKKSVLKGFTLIELLIVMAIFSVLMAAALALTTPVSRMYKNTALAEKTYSYSHNIQEYLQGTLEYADSLYVYTEDHLGIYDGDLKALADEFRDKHYKDVVLKDGNGVRKVRGKIYILHLLNKSDGTNPQGQILLSEYPFSDNVIDNAHIVSERPMLNPAYFSASDSDYSFSYALGSSKFVSLDSTPAGGKSGETYKVLRADRDDLDNGVDRTSLSLSIVLDKDKTSEGYVDVTNGAYTYRAFKSPVAVQVANLPLTNINTSSKRRPNLDAGMARPIQVGGDVRLQSTAATPIPESGESFRKAFNSKIDFTQDIYFVFAYGDELR
ncbi:prepilin-type N-terminal cleavage/methylation domain-containing protein [Ruminococcus sp.]|uniref:type II secretion system protein n=1 Tax=Ruminococcus sp. TaxID=41978 RepID=UPI0026004114|nr:prepilin-type N-terminal cleavage/methylation domain-containing protein [Ruminococcus sp.]MCR4638449.1 prepilin-type N-terminal cleavage/methylation domain-containing protein [Ruminococcus sp.]